MQPLSVSETSQVGKRPAVLRRASTDYRALEFRLSQHAGLSPYFKAISGHVGPAMLVEGEERVMLGSNNYLGLTSHPAVTEAAARALEQYGTGMTGSRVLNGTLTLHEELEAELADWLGTEDALVFSTGYQANVGLLSGLLGSDDVIVCDSANHASILDGAALSGARLMPFRHGRVDRLERLLERKPPSGGGVLVIVDGVFSMEGDLADLPKIASLCTKHGAALVVDEAHAIGVLGVHGQGVVDELDVTSDTHLRVGTFSKSLASCGGFVVGDTDVLEMLRVKSRSFVFSAAGVPAAVGAALAAVRVCRSPEGTELMARLHENVACLRQGLQQRDLPVVAASRVDGREISSAIVPVLVGNDYYGVLLWKALYERGIYTNVALYPAVPKNKALIRMSVMAAHTSSHLDRAVEAFADVASKSEALEEQARLLYAHAHQVARGATPKSAAEIAAALASAEAG
jgi:8-amino-7-oxononanoate synthase